LAAFDDSTVRLSATHQKVPMSIGSIPSSSSQGGSLSRNVTTFFAVVAAMTFSASGAPTPLYQEYQSHFGLTRRSLVHARNVGRF
jgi:hypothetical protein